MVGALVVAGACGGADRRGAPGTAGRPPTTAAPSPSGGSATAPAGGAGPPEPPRLAAEKVADLDQPVALAQRPGDDTFYVAEKGGRVRAVRGSAVAGAPVLDLSGEVSTGGERGLLGLVFSPDGSRLYVNFTDLQGDTRVVELAWRDGAPDPSSRRQVLAVDQPFANHNGGNLVFGPDGFLYIGLGDGGSGGDPLGNAQDLGMLLGKMLRIDPRPDGDRPYTIPPGNPFVGRAGVRPEIWAYGLRNPWRYSFDRLTRDLWIGDVGERSREEIDRAPGSSRGGENYGWNHLEGTRPFTGAPPPGRLDPVYDYPTGDGNCAVTGGYVYRGARMATLQGVYVFADFCRGSVLGLVPTPSGLRARDLGARVDNLASFGQDAGGELYALSLSGGLFRLVAR